MNPKCCCNGGADLVAAPTKSYCHKASCSNATEVGASKQGTGGPHFWDAFINDMPCLNCGHRRPPALRSHLGSLLWILVGDPGCYCNGGTDLGAATTRASCHKASCSGATEVGASKQGTGGPHFWIAFVTGMPCLNCGQRRSPACLISFWVLILDPCFESQMLL